MLVEIMEQDNRYDPTPGVYQVLTYVHIVAEETVDNFEKLLGRSDDLEMVVRYLQQAIHGGILVPQLLQEVVCCQPCFHVTWGKQLAVEVQELALLLVQDTVHEEESLVGLI